MGKTPKKPERPTKKVKDEVVRFRISAEQKVTLEAKAAAEGMDLSTWLRRLALKSAGLLPEAK